MRPKLYDHIYNHFRLECGKMPYGYVIYIPEWRPWMSRDEPREVLVKYFNPSPSLSQWDSTFGLPGGDTDYITQDAFDECKVSSEWQGFDYIDHRSERRKYHERGVVNRRDQPHGNEVDDDDVQSGFLVSRSRLSATYTSRDHMASRSIRKTT